MSKSALALVLLFVALSTHYCMGALSTSLRVGFYNGKCGTANVEATVARLTQKWWNQDPTITAALLRIQFHDCFVNGCDASILLDGEDSEKMSGTNVGLRGFDVIDDIKQALETSCPGVVSCADVISLATRDAVVLAGGPRYVAETGRRDGNLSQARLVGLSIPDPDISVSESIQLFKNKGVSTIDMAYLLGAHTVGVANCSFFQDRLYDFNGTGKPDPSMSKPLLASLRRSCPLNATVDRPVQLDQNRTSTLTVDNSYYKQLKRSRGVLQIDQELASHPETDFIVDIASRSVSDFNTRFSDAMVHLGAVDVLTGVHGEIRTSCRVVNSNKI